MEFFKNYFTRETLAGVLAKTPYVPGRLGELGLFASRGLTSTTALIEELATNDVTVGSAIARGAPATQIGLDVRKMHPFNVQSFGFSSTILADQVLNVRSAGGNAAEVIQTRVNEATAKLRRQADLQHESLRMACLKSATNTIGNQPASQVIAVQTDGTKLREEIFNKIQLPLETALGGIPFTGIRVLCSNGYWAKLIENKWIKDTYLNTSASAVLRNAGVTEEVMVGSVTFERYRGAGTVVIATDTAIAVPLGVPDLFLQCFAPDDTLSSVGAGAMGAPYYLSSIPIEGDKGYKLTLQTHPVMVCARPEAILTFSLA